MEQIKNTDDIINEMLSTTPYGQEFLRHRRNHPQDTIQLINNVQELVAHHGMSVSAAKGFFDYMGVVIERRSRVKGVE